MKIKYKKITCSTNLKSYVLIQNIFAELDKPGYRVTMQNQECVEFENNIWRFGSRMDAFKYVDGGVFEINPIDKTISFSFYISLTFEALAIFIAAFFAFTQDNNLFFFIPFILIMLVVRAISIKLAADKMIGKILILDL